MELATNITLDIKQSSKGKDYLAFTLYIGEHKKTYIADFGSYGLNKDILEHAKKEQIDIYIDRVDTEKYHFINLKIALQLRNKDVIYLPLYTLKDNRESLKQFLDLEYGRL